MAYGEPSILFGQVLTTIYWIIIKECESATTVGPTPQTKKGNK